MVLIQITRVTDGRNCRGISVRPSHTRVICIKTTEHIIEILSPPDRRVILVFRRQGLLRKSDGFTPKGEAEYKGGCDFRPICGYISEKVG